MASSKLAVRTTKSSSSSSFLAMALKQQTITMSEIETPLYTRPPLTNEVMLQFSVNWCSSSRIGNTVE